MITLEEKVNVCLRAIAANDDDEWLKAAEKARKILAESASETTIGGYSENQIRYETEMALKVFGVPCNNVGYEYLVESVVAVIYNRHIINYITSELYPLVAKKCNATNVHGVERGIRHEIELLYRKGNLDALEDILGYPDAEKCKFTNASFIAALARYVRYKVFGTK